MLSFLVLGFLIGIFVGQAGLLTFPPGTHKAIVENTSIQDTTFEFWLEPKLVASRSIEWSKQSMVHMSFAKEKSYRQTTWLWQRYGDTEVAMTIWGPGDDGRTYLIEFGRLGGNAFDIKCFDETASWARSTSQGWIHFTIELATA